MTEITTRAAIQAVLASELRRNPKAVYMGETVRGPGATGASAGLYEEFGPKQVIETPVSENGFFGAALGLALSGFHPIVEIYSADFALAVANEIINDMAKWRQQQARGGRLPITIRGWMGATSGLGPEHSQCMEAYFHHAPGLTVICPGTTEDMSGLLRAALRCGDPVLFLEHRQLYDKYGAAPDDEFSVPIGRGAIVRAGSDVTLVAWAWMRQAAIEAAQALAENGISVEVIDPRTIKPLDFGLIVASVRKTGRLIVAEEAPMTGNIGAEIIARVCEVAAVPIAVARVAMPDVIHPYSASMESKILPDAASIVRTAQALIDGRPTFPAIKEPWASVGSSVSL